MTAPVKTALTYPEDLLAEGLVTPADMPALEQVAGHFRIRVTPAMRAAITTPADYSELGALLLTVTLLGLLLPLAAILLTRIARLRSA